MQTRPFQTRNRLTAILLAAAMCALVHVPAWTQEPGPLNAPSASLANLDRVTRRAADWLQNHPPTNDPSSPVFAIAIAARHSVTPPIPVDVEQVRELLDTNPELAPFVTLIGYRPAEGAAHPVSDSPWARAMLAALTCTQTVVDTSIATDLFSQDPWIVTHTATALQWMFEQGCVLPADWLTLQAAIATSLQRIASELDVTTTLGTEILAVVLYTRTPLEGIERRVEELRQDMSRDGSFVAPDNDTWHRTMLAWWALLEWQHQANADLPPLTRLVPRPNDGAIPASFQGVVLSNVTALPVPQPTPIALEIPNADPHSEASGAGATPQPETDGSGETTAALPVEAIDRPTSRLEGSAPSAATPEPAAVGDASGVAPARVEPEQALPRPESTQRAPVGCMGG